MNKVYLDKDGKLFVNGNLVEDVYEISTRTNHLGCEVQISLKADYKSDFISDIKKHSINECSKEWILL